MFEKNTKEVTETPMPDVLEAETEMADATIVGMVTHIQDDEPPSMTIDGVNVPVEIVSEQPQENPPMSDNPALAIDYGMFSEADVVVEGAEIVITIPLKYGVQTVRAPKAVVAAWAMDNVAGRVMDAAKQFAP